jgi:hypothetical protein
LRLDFVAATQFNAFAVALGAAFLISRIPMRTLTHETSWKWRDGTKVLSDEQTTLWILLGAALLWAVLRNALPQTTFGFG